MPKTQTNIVTLGELFGQDLAGWQIGYGYFLELNHGLMGLFPAILNDGDDDRSSYDGKIVIVLEKHLLREVWDHVEPARAQITKILVLAHKELGIAFDLHGIESRNARILKIYSQEALATLLAKKDSVRWSPGLGGARGKYPPPDFNAPDDEE